MALRHVVLTSETYGLPINTGATQKSGPTPLRDWRSVDVNPLENDQRQGLTDESGGRP